MRRIGRFRCIRELVNEAIDDVLDIDYGTSAVRKQFNLAPRISTSTCRSNLDRRRRKIARLNRAARGTTVNSGRIDVTPRGFDVGTA